MSGDLKEGLSGNRKPDITHVRTPFMIYTARSCEYGDMKYERANYARPVSETAPSREDFKRFRAYLRAAASHIMQTLDAMEFHQATDPQLDDIEGMKLAAYAPDTDMAPGSKYPPSLLPHVAAACASLNMAVTQAVRYGLLPPDPGQPWTKVTDAMDTLNPSATVEDEPTPEQERHAKIMLEAEAIRGARAAVKAAQDSHDALSETSVLRPQAKAALDDARAFLRELETNLGVLPEDA